MANWWDDPDLQDKKDKAQAGPVTHGLEVIGEGALHAVPDTIGFFGDIANEARKALANHFNKVTGGDAPPQRLHFPGTGEVSQKVSESYGKAQEEYTGGNTPQPRNRAERYANSAARMAADALITGGPKHAGSAVASGLSSGVAQEAASEVFPNSPTAQVIATIVGGGLPALTHLRPGETGRAINRGMAHPDWQAVNDVIVGDLEGGGTLANPKRSPKGALGPQQVMPDTARDPGFNIRPWNGKTQADLARVGRQYSAAMMDKYNGDATKVLAAYNGGPGRVDHLIKKYGADWHEHLPQETRDYVAKGIRKLDPQREVFSKYNDIEVNREVEKARELEPLIWNQEENDPHAQDILHQADDSNVTAFPEDRIANVDRTGPSSDVPFRMTKESGIPNIDDARANRYQRDMEENTKKLKEHDDNYVNDLSDSADHLHTILDNHLDGQPTLSEGELKEVRQRWEDLNSRMEKSKLLPLGHGVVKEVLRKFDWFEEQLKRNEGSIERPIVDNTGYEKHTPYVGEPKKAANDPKKRGVLQTVKDMLNDDSATLKGDNDNPHNIADARKKKELRDFHANLMSKVHDRIQIAKALAQKVRDEGLLPYNVGDRFTTPKGRKLKQGPWKVIGYYVDPKNPERYGYYVERGRPDIDRESSIMLVSDPAADTKYKEQFGMKDWDRAKEVAGWQKQGIVRRLLNDDEGALKGGNEPPEGRDGKDFHDPEEKLIRAINEARPASLETKGLVSEVKKNQAKRLAELQARGASLPEQLSALKGKLPSADYESIAHHFSSEDKKALEKKINDSRAMSAFDKLNTTQALDKLLDAKSMSMPTEKELDKLADVFSPDLVKALVDRHKGVLSVNEKIANVGGIPRTIMSSADISAPARQGILFVGRKEFWQNYPKMLKMFGNLKYYDQAMQEIKERPNYILMRQGGLAVRDSVMLKDREEYFISNMAEHMPGNNVFSKGYNNTVGAVVRASDRAYTGFLRKLRADVFDTLVEKGRVSGIDWESNPKKLKMLSRFINTATGRGDLGKFEQASQAFSTIFFAPRLGKARYDTLMPHYYAQLYHADPMIAKEAFKSLASFSVIAATVLGLAVAGGAKVEGDLRSSDGLKIRIGQTRVDILGGIQQYLHFAAQMAGKKKTQKGQIQDLRTGKFGQDTRWDVIEKFITSKFAPIPGVARDYLNTKDPAGNKFSWKTDLSKLVMPMDVSDVVDSMKKNGAKGAWAALPSILGVSVQTYSPHPSKAKKSANWWADSTPKSKEPKQWWTE
jgi:hypothetical protein